MRDLVALTVQVPKQIADRLHDWATLCDRTESSMVADALGEWLAEEERRHRLTLEAIADVDEGRVFTHEEALAHFESMKAKRRNRSAGTATPPSSPEPR